MIHKASDRIALHHISSNYALSYENLHCKIESIKNYLIANGFGSGDKVCVFVDKNIDYILLFYALNSLKCVVIPLHEDLVTKHITYIQDSVNPDYLITKTHKSLIDDYEIKKFVTYKKDVSVFPRDVALISYTSGTTAEPKGVLITNKNLKSIIQAMNEFIPLNDTNVLAILYMQHMYGFSIFLSVLNQGATLYLDDNTNLNELLHLFEVHAIEGIFINAKNIEYFLNEEILKHQQFKNIRFISSASFGIDIKNIVKFVRANNNLDFYAFYALSEVPRATCIKNPHKLTQDFVPIGITSSQVQMKIEMRKLRTLCAGDYGEIAFYGHLVAAGYAANADKGITLFQDRWFFTGDLVKVHNNGLLEYVGRVKDLLTIKGAFVLPQEIESHYKSLCCMKKNVFDILDSNLLHVVEAKNVLCTNCQINIDMIDEKIKKRYCVDITRQYVERIPINSQGKIVRFNVVKNIER